jgi:uncharacterized protein (UPF0262 family)
MPEARDPRYRLTAVVLDEASIARSTPDVEHERIAAIWDLVEDADFRPAGHAGGPYKLSIGLLDKKLMLEITDAAGAPVAAHILSLNPLRKIVKDYFLICESYYQAIRTATPSQIEAIDMGRRGVHDEGSRVLRERLDGKVNVDHDTARRLFTLICALQWKG